MGSSINGDKDAKLFVTLRKRVYYAGEMVEGAVHLNCSAERYYRFLNLLIEGQEQIRWSEQHNKHHTTVYRN
jgi:hypothetical protein